MEPSESVSDMATDLPGMKRDSRLIVPGVPNPPRKDRVVRLAKNLSLVEQGSVRQGSKRSDLRSIAEGQEVLVGCATGAVEENVMKPFSRQGQTMEPDG